MSETWIILGATSGMAKTFARELAERGDALLLAGRDMAELEVLAADARARGARLAEAVVFDARHPDSFQPLIDRAARETGTLSAAIFLGFL